MRMSHALLVGRNREVMEEAVRPGALSVRGSRWSELGTAKKAVWQLKSLLPLQ